MLITFLKLICALLILNYNITSFENEYHVLLRCYNSDFTFYIGPTHGAITQGTRTIATAA